MFKLFSIVEEKESPINGKIQIVRDFQGARIIAGGVSQSGWLVKSVWKAALKRIKSQKKEIKSVLILGLGGGSAAELVVEYWPEAKITGVDLDPLMIDMGKKYLRLGEIENLKVIVADAQKWLDETRDRKKEKYDLVLVDLFNGSKIPEKFYRDKFVDNVQKLVLPGGVVAFNHLYSFYERENSKKLQKVLRRFFATISTVLPEANIIFLCFNE